MKKSILILSLLLIASWTAIAHKNREPDSPAKGYKFCLNDIQITVRAALQKADEVLKCLTQDGQIEGIARLYFHDYLEKIASYNLSPAQTVDLVESYKTELVNAFVLKEFKERYPHLIYDRSGWFFNSVGGIYANSLLLHVSPKEYIVLWGTTLRADNKFSGYYPFMNEFDVMVRGRMESHNVDAPGHASVIYRPFIQDGIMATTVDTSNLIPKNVRAYNLDAHSYMVSYAQGNILKAFLPGAIMPGVFVNQDWTGLSAHIRESYRAYKTSKKKYRKTSSEEQFNFMVNPNYRAIWIIEEYRNSLGQKK